MYSYNLPDENNNTVSYTTKNKFTFTCLFITACYTGMKPSQICALTWDDIDFEKRIIKVRHYITK